MSFGAEAAAPKDLGMAEEVRPTSTVSEQPVWPDEAFSAQFPRWEKAVQAGLKSVDDILTLAKTKGALTQMQEAAIRALKPAQQGSADVIDEGEQPA
jgi:trans-aconitate methyltransferase